MADNPTGFEPNRAESMNEQTTLHQSAVKNGANSRFRDSFSSWFWGSMIAATAVHFGFFAFLEFGEIQDASVIIIDRWPAPPPPEVELPPPPEAIAPPAAPVVMSSANDMDIPIAPVTFDKNPVAEVLRPDVLEGHISSSSAFTPHTVAPDYTNVHEVRRALEREYPPLLRGAGIGGTVRVWFFIDENGVVQNQVVNLTSGHQALDSAALRVAPIFKFTPALNRDKAVPVWVSLPITFRPK